MPPIEAPGTNTFDVAHQERQVGLSGVQHKVVVVIHQAPRQGTGIKPMQRLTQNDQQAVAIIIAQHDGLAPVTPRGHVVDGTGGLDSQWSCHLQNLRKLTAWFGD